MNKRGTLGLICLATVLALIGTFSWIRVVLTENVADFVTIAAQYSTTGGHHPGLMIALSSRFSRRPSGHAALVKAIQAHRADELTDRIFYLEVPSGDDESHRSVTRSSSPPVETRLAESAADSRTCRWARLGSHGAADPDEVCWIAVA